MKQSNSRWMFPVVGISEQTGNKSAIAHNNQDATLTVLIGNDIVEFRRVPLNVAERKHNRGYVRLYPTENGFQMNDRFGDQITQHVIAPARTGQKKAA